MNSISPPIHSPPPPAVYAMLSYSAKLLLTETSSANDKRDASNSTLEDLARRATAITITIQSVEGYAHFGIND